MQIDLEEEIQRYLFRKRHGREGKMSRSFCVHWALKVMTTVVIWKREKETLPKWRGTSFLTCISKHVSSEDSALRAHSSDLFSWRWTWSPYCGAHWWTVNEPFLIVTTSPCSKCKPSPGIQADNPSFNNSISPISTISPASWIQRPHLLPFLSIFFYTQIPFHLITWESDYH